MKQIPLHDIRMIGTLHTTKIKVMWYGNHETDTASRYPNDWYSVPYNPNPHNQGLRLRGQTSVGSANRNRLFHASGHWESDLLILIQTTVRRLRSKQLNKRDPITLEMVSRLADYLKWMTIVRSCVCSHNENRTSGRILCTSSNGRIHLNSKGICGRTQPLTRVCEIRDRERSQQGNNND